MKSKFERALVNFAVAAATGVVSAALLNGQINPATSTGSQAAPSGQVQKTDQPSPPQALNGTWKLNADKSDDAEKKLRGTQPYYLSNDAVAASRPEPGSPIGRRQAIGGNRGCPRTARWSGPLGRAPPRRRRRQRPTEKLCWTYPSALHVSDSGSERKRVRSHRRKQLRKRAFFTDGRKLLKS